MRVLGSTLLLSLAVGLVGCGEPDVDGDGVIASLDCDDNNANAYPKAQEVCDGVDNNCDKFVDELENVVDATLWYLDRDVDTFGDDTVSQMACARPGGGWAERGGDCNDSDPLANPDASEVCNGKDDDCDGTEDEPEEASGTQTWYEDWDFDSFGDIATAQEFCPQKVPRLWVQNAEDCNDRDANVYPGADEYCNDEDDDCDGDIDELREVLDGFDAWKDVDSDGYGDPITKQYVCELPTGFVTNGRDCRDSDAIVALGCGCTTGDAGDLTVARGATVTVEGGVKNYKNVRVEAGGTLRFTGNLPVFLFAERVEILGTVDIAAKGRDPGPGGGGGGSSGDCYAAGGAGGAGYATKGSGGGGGTAYYSTGGGGGGSADVGGSGISGTYGAGGKGGDRFGDVALETEFSGGGGGGGGGAQGGAGGGGGGALKVVAGEIVLSGTIDARGASGSSAASSSCYYGGGGGGGGAGGSVWLHGDRVDFTGSINIAGGTYGNGRAGSYYYYEGTRGGGASVGRARVSGKVLTNTGTVTDVAFTDKADPTCDIPFETE